MLNNDIHIPKAIVVIVAPNIHIILLLKKHLPYNAIARPANVTTSE